jgi:SAM-dependent methyltransferase
LAETATGAAAYDNDFYQHYVDGMASSAAHVLRVLYGFFQPASILDVGCGRGAWLQAAGRLGTATRHGMDGPWVRVEDLLDPDIVFTPVDFEQPLPRPGQRFDLAMSVEVAEHVSEKNADGFVDALCAASDVVLFGAAIRYQGGEHHVNEQRQSYWVGRFSARGFDCYDVLRAALWDEEAVKWWYRQNTFLFVRSGSTAVDVERLRAAVRPVVDIVHPALFESRARKARRLETPTLGDCVKLVRRYLRNTGRRALGLGERGS